MAVKQELSVRNSLTVSVSLSNSMTVSLTVSLVIFSLSVQLKISLSVSVCLTIRLSVMSVSLSSQSHCRSHHQSHFHLLCQSHIRLDFHPVSLTISLAGNLSVMSASPSVTMLVSHKTLGKKESSIVQCPISPISQVCPYLCSL